jgi:hypothetical protein
VSFVLLPSFLLVWLTPTAADYCLAFLIALQVSRTTSCQLLSARCCDRGSILCSLLTEPPQLLPPLSPNQHRYPPPHLSLEHSQLHRPSSSPATTLSLPLCSRASLLRPHPRTITANNNILTSSSLFRLSKSSHPRPSSTRPPQTTQPSSRNCPNSLPLSPRPPQIPPRSSRSSVYNSYPSLKRRPSPQRRPSIRFSPPSSPIHRHSSLSSQQNHSSLSSTSGGSHVSILRPRVISPSFHHQLPSTFSHRSYTNSSSTPLLPYQSLSFLRLFAFWPMPSLPSLSPRSFFRLLTPLHRPHLILPLPLRLPPRRHARSLRRYSSSFCWRRMLA